MKKKPKSKYKKEYAHMAYVACSEGGFTDVKLGKLFRKCKATINNWKKDYPEFLDSIKKGKDEFDCEKVEKSLLKRALGYRYTETTKENSIKSDDLIVTKKVRKEVSPDSKAAMDWLCNRNPGRWKKIKHVEVTGPGGGPVGVKVDPWEELMGAVQKDNSDELPNKSQRKV